MKNHVDDLVDDFTLPQTMSSEEDNTSDYSDSNSKSKQQQFICRPTKHWKKAGKLYRTNSLSHLTLSLQKQLLLDIHDCGGLRSNKIWLKELCDKKLDIYGESGSETCDSVCQKVFWWKQTGASGWAKLYEDFKLDVTPPVSHSKTATVSSSSCYIQEHPSYSNSISSNSISSGIKIHHEQRG
jgi:hypothetical protein